MVGWEWPAQKLAADERVLMPVLFRPDAARLPGGGPRSHPSAGDTFVASHEVRGQSSPRNPGAPGCRSKRAKQDTQPFASGAHAVVWAAFERSARLDMAELSAGKRADALRARDRLTETARGARHQPVEALVEAARGR